MAADWFLIQRLAIEKLSVKLPALGVWVARKHVPHKHRLALIKLSDGAITADDFDRMDKARARVLKALPKGDEASDCVG